MDLAKMLAGLGDDEDRNKPFEGDAEIEAEVVVGLRDALIEPRTFKPGDLIEWKPGLKHLKAPAYGQPSVVMAVLAEPVFDTELGSGSAYWRQPLDLVIGLRNGGDFVEFHTDSRRFRPWKGAAS